MNHIVEMMAEIEARILEGFEKSTNLIASAQNMQELANSSLQDSKKNIEENTHKDKQK